MNIAVSPSLPASVAAELAACLYATPFDILGLHAHPSGKGLVIRAWRPDAVAIEVLDYQTGKLLGTMTAHEEGLFELHLPRRKKPFLYQLNIHWANGHSFRLFDPYSFGQYVLKQTDIESDYLHRHMGASVTRHAINSKHQIEGVLFKVYAPYARTVNIVGSFNGWDDRLHPMASADDGIWRLFIPGVMAGDQYKYSIHDYHGGLLPLKTDPFAQHLEQWPGLASVVQNPDGYCWDDQGWLARRRDSRNQALPLSIYEVHAGSWKRKEDDGFLNFRELADQLIPYVLDMGFTHLELMPVSEHPLFDSWGYQPVGLFAPSSRYGSPDDFRYFVDKCHQKGIGVILDWVPAHFPSDDHGLAKFDGSSLYEHSDSRRGWHPDWQTCIYDFGKPWVQDFLISNALYWLDEFHIDGLRVDAVASMLYLDYSRDHGEWEANIHGGNENLEAVAFLKKFNETVHTAFPDVMTIAEESTSWPGVSKAVNEGGLGFDFKWNMGWMNDTLEYMKLDPVYRQHHHGQMTFSTVYAWSENFVLPLSHDEVVHGKGTILTRMPGDDWQKFANLRTYLAFMYTHPGKKLLFMGTELGTHKEWNQNAALDWDLLENTDGFNAGVQKLVKTLNHLHGSEPALYERDMDAGGFAWATCDDSGQSVLAFRRYDSHGRSVQVVCNLTPVVRHNYRIGVPEGGQYSELLNTDDRCFGGSGVKAGEHLQAEEIPMHHQPYSIALTLPPLATVILALS
ncbi:1,4-alpha-glucan branching protein GlgB [Endozoicomonas sp.]|uniref:1,4-alpha-glucan branching protein GlgB n=1 Tax=Endozoicomonas sp. TaxID=1892382 RepID=UPI0028867478|nr:1,4-alpha-glucan branching protein GlgB [Endozoicomonas sp.]